MLENYYMRHARIRSLLKRPGGRFLGSFAEELWQKGYAEITAHKHLRAAEHFIYLTNRDEIPIQSLTEALIKRFDDHLPQCQCPGFGRSNRLELLGGIRLFLKHLSHWRLSSLPRYVQPEEVERIIDSCNPDKPIGRRDRAILLLLTRLGLRAGDVLKLRLGDIDWKGAWIYVTGKGRRQTRLPLTQEVGDAIVSYMQNGRPQTDSDVLFIRSRAPFRAFSNHCAISVIVSQAMSRAGVICQSRGADHVLRHSVATSMLRQGASLQDIATLLRHSSIATTEIYAKVDVTTLKQIAQPWPEAPTC